MMKLIWITLEIFRQLPVSSDLRKARKVQDFN